MGARTFAGLCWGAVLLAPPARAAGTAGTDAHEAAPSADVQVCLDATVEGQRLRDAGAYLRARERFIACAAEQCPGEVRKTCVGWLADLERLVPTVVFAAVAGGKDVSDVRVSVDGLPLAERIDGKPVPLDPGERRIRFERSGEPPQEQSVVLRAGEKGRLVAARFGPEAAPPTAESQPPSPPASPAPDRFALAPGAFYGLGVSGLAAFVAGVALDASGYVFVQQCSGDRSCSGEHERAEVKWRFVTGDLLLAAGVATGVVAWVLRPGEPRGRGSARAPSLGASWDTRGGKIDFTVAF